MRASSLKYGLLLVLSLGLAACGSDMDDLDQYINEIKARLRLAARVLTPIAAANISRVSPWTRSAWSARCISVRRCTD